MYIKPANSWTRIYGLSRTLHHLQEHAAGPIAFGLNRLGHTPRSPPGASLLIVDIPDDRSNVHVTMDPWGRSLIGLIGAGLLPVRR